MPLNPVTRRRILTLSPFALFGSIFGLGRAFGSSAAVEPRALPDQPEGRIHESGDGISVYSDDLGAALLLDHLMAEGFAESRAASQVVTMWGIAADDSWQSAVVAETALRSQDGRLAVLSDVVSSEIAGLGGRPPFAQIWKIDGDKVDLESTLIVNQGAVVSI
jgi:hypothetical protein